jgi:sporulation protein YlmC with PRC-barrel domain
VNFLVSANLITGKKVVATNGDAIGEVKDADFDTETWKINSLLYDVLKYSPPTMIC